MFKTKYYRRILELQARHRAEREFLQTELEPLQHQTWQARLLSGLLENPLWLLGLLRRFMPVLRVGNFYLLSNSNDVREVLQRNDRFETPFAPEMQTMGEGYNFILGMQDTQLYRKQKAIIIEAFSLDTIEDEVKQSSSIVVARYITGLRSHFNPIQDLFRDGAARVCAECFGLQVNDYTNFATDAQALSALLFSDFTGHERKWQLGMAGAQRLVRILNRSIQYIQSGKTTKQTPLKRLLDAHASDPEQLSLSEIRSIMLGMISGFVPTNTLAEGNILQVLLQKPAAKKALLSAIDANDDGKIKAVLLEALRFKPIRVGPHRYANDDFVLSHSGKLIKKGSTVLVATLAAMFDPATVERPEDFDPGRDSRYSMVYGHDLHYCLGAGIANAHMVEIFKGLFSLPQLRPAQGRAGQLHRIGPFPDAFFLEFDDQKYSAKAKRSMITLVLNLGTDDGAEALNARLDALGNLTPASSSRLCTALDQAAFVHFISGHVIKERHSKSANQGFFALFEISADGDRHSILKKLAAILEPELGEILRAHVVGHQASNLVEMFNDGMLDLGPTSASGLSFCFEGLPELSVRRIFAEKALADAARAVVETQQGDATRILHAVRLQLGDSTEHSRSILELPAAFLSSEARPWIHVLKVFADKPIGILCALIVFVVALVVNYEQLAAGSVGFWTLVWYMGTSISLTILAFVLIFVFAVTVFLGLLRRKERQESQAQDIFSQQHYSDLARRENRALNNHMMVITELKPGWLRWFSLRLIFSVIGLFAEYVYKKGTLSGLDSIHFARWVQIPASDKLIFLSNYSGSWISYLEDFISKASFGLSGVWSHCIGFPNTRFLIFDGAKNGPLFKNWARKHQQPTLFWYSAYPDMGTRGIRRNSAIQAGLRDATTAAEAQRWLENFGSIVNSNKVLEKAQIQSLVFSGLGRLRCSRALGLQLDQGNRQKSISTLLDQLQPYLSFDEIPHHRLSVQIAFSNRGLKKLGVFGQSISPESQGFSHPFLSGMDHQNRTNILGDIGPDAPEHWQWGHGENSVDVLLLFYAHTEALIETNINALFESVDDNALKTVLNLSTSLAESSAQVKEPFGFRDGISQPILGQTAKSFAKNDLVNTVQPGEIVFGYQDQSGQTTPSAKVLSDSDISDVLSNVSPTEGLDFRDFGQNGSYLVVRQLQQSTKEFDAYCAAQSRSLIAKTGDDRYSEHWIAAKMIGRWKNGQSLVRCPLEPGAGKKLSTDTVDNEFRFGHEDPQGLRCPLGAHIRRSNPRDSLATDRDEQLHLSNRHRILRVGRAYALKQNDSIKKGLLFMCLNVDLERQFEFVQQTWLNSRGFHGLNNEVDPLFVKQANSASSRFTIPSATHPIVLKNLPQLINVKGGAYFFLPSKRALDYLRAMA